MFDPAQVGHKEFPEIQQRLAQLLSTYVHDPLAPQPEEVEHLLSILAAHQLELEEQNHELHERQEHLEAYRDRYIDLYDFAPLGYVTLDEDGFVQEINLAGANLLGVDRNALTGYSFGDYVSKKDQNVFLDHVYGCVKERHEVTSELLLESKDNRCIAVQLHSIPIEGQQEDTLCKTAITDITQRRSMEETIRQSQAFLQTVIDAIPESMLVIGRDYRIVLVNRACARWLRASIRPVV